MSYVTYISVWRRGVVAVRGRVVGVGRRQGRAQRAAAVRLLQRLPRLRDEALRSLVTSYIYVQSLL